MVNVFGCSSSKRGPPGPPGEPGPPGKKGRDGIGGIESIVRWLPQTTLEEFRKNETACFLLTNPSKDLKCESGKYVRWISRSNSKLDAVAINPSTKIVDISEHRHGLHFQNNVYKVSNVRLSPADDDAYVCICITFQNCDQTKRDQFLISNYGPDQEDPTNFRGISLHNSNIKIWGVNNEESFITIPIQDKKLIRTVFVQYRNSDNSGSYVIKDCSRTMHGVFISRQPPMFEAEEFFLGGQIAKEGVQNLSNGCISAVKVHVVPVPESEEEGMPIVLRDLVVHIQ